MKSTAKSTACGGCIGAVMNVTSLRRCSCIILFLVGSTVLFGCGTPEIYRDETFHLDTQFSRRIKGAGDIVCESVKRALLNQGYHLEDRADPAMVTGTKAFQRDEQTVTLRLQTFCIDNRDGSYTVFASAQQEVSELQEVRQPAGVSVGAFGITVPSGSAKVPVTMERETIQDADFYARLYK